MSPIKSLLFGAALLLPLTIACGDKDTDDTATADGGAADGGADGGSADGGSGDGGSDGGAGDGGTGDGGGMGDGGSTGMDCETEVFGDLPPTGKKAFMEACVAPVMKVDFQNFDPKRFAVFNCDTCHGTGAMEAEEYRMPAVAAFGEPSTWPPGFQGFMLDLVVPKMTDILSAKEYNPKTGRGFSCGNCHLSE